MVLKWSLAVPHIWLHKIQFYYFHQFECVVSYVKKKLWTAVYWKKNKCLVYIRDTSGQRHYFFLLSNYIRSSRRCILLRCSVKKKWYSYNFANFTGKHLRWSLSLIKMKALRPAILLKRDPNTEVLINIKSNKGVLTNVDKYLKK